MNDFEALLNEVLKLRRDLEEHKVATRNMIRVGPVKDRDKDKGVRVAHGTDEEPDDSPWVQGFERSGVERYTPKNGEQVAVLSPYGDPEQGSFLPFGHSDDHPNPATDVDETVFFNRDGYKVSLKDGKVTHELKDQNGKVSKFTMEAGKSIETEVDGTKNTLTKDGTKFSNGYVRHDDKDVGKTHKHEGGMLGGGSTDVPEVWT